MNETYRVELAGAGSVVVRIARQPVPWFTDEAHIMAQARAVGVPTAEVLGVEHVEHDGELLSFSIQRLLPGRSLDELAGELPAADLERLVMDGGELLARVHSLVPDRGVRHELQPPDERSLARGARIVEQTLGPSAVSVVERGAEFLRRELAARPAPSLALAQGDWVPKHLLIDDGAIVGVIDWEFAGPASPAYDFAMWEVSAGDGLHDRSDAAAPRVCAGRRSRRGRRRVGARVGRRLGARSARLAQPRVAGADSAMRGRDRPLRRRMTLTCGQGACMCADGQRSLRPGGRRTLLVCRFCYLQLAPHVKKRPER